MLGKYSVEVKTKKRQEETGNEQQHPESTSCLLIHSSTPTSSEML